MADSTQTPDPDSSQEIPPGSEETSGRRRRRVAGAPAGAPAPTVAPEPAADPAASAVRRTTVPEQSETVPEPAPVVRRTRRRAAGSPAGAPAAPTFTEPEQSTPAHAAAAETEPASEPDAPVDDDTARAQDSESQRTVAPAQEGAQTQPATAEDAEHEQGSDLDAVPSPVVEDLRALADARGGAEPQPDEQDQARREQVQMDFASLLFQAPAPAQPRTTVGAGDAPVGSSELAFEAGGLTEDDQATEEESSGIDDTDDTDSSGTEKHEDRDQDRSSSSGGSRRRRRRGGRGRRGRGRGEDEHRDSSADSDQDSDKDGDSSSEDSAESGSSSSERSGDGDSGGSSSSSSRRRRRRRRSGSSSGSDESTSADDPPNTVVRVREARDEVKAVKGSTRLEAKKQRRREGRDAGRRRNVITEAEFLARRESVKRSMVVRERAGRTQIAVLEDDVLVEHYVAQKSQTSMVGNVYLGKVQNVLPSMEAAFVDVGKGRNAVLYAGEVNWDAVGMEGQPRRIELALKSGDPVLVQVTKDPIGHKGARLTSQISLPGRYLVFVPGGSMTGISRKLPDTERARLKKIMRQIIPEDAGVIVRTAAEGASEEELTRDVERLRSQWEKIQKAQKSKSAPAALSQEPDLAIKVVRDVFNEDFTSLIVEGSSVHDEIHDYVSSVAPDLLERVTAHSGPKDVFAKYRIDEQLLKAMDRKVYLPSGGSLVIDRTEAMTVVDVNTGKFTGSGGTLEETVTKNNLEAAEEIVRQLRLRDVGGIIVIDFIDMVLESNRDLVLRRLVECLGRDRTKHQVAEVTSLGLVQMTRKRVGQGLVDTFSTTCEHCHGRGLHVDMDGTSHTHGNGGGDDSSRSSKRRNRRSRSNGSGKEQEGDSSEEKGSDVHRLEDDADSRALARATIASIAAASSSQSQPEVTVDGQAIGVDDSRESGSEAQASASEQASSESARPEDEQSSSEPSGNGPSEGEGPGAEPERGSDPVADAEQAAAAAGAGGAIPVETEQASPQQSEQDASDPSESRAHGAGGTPPQGPEALPTQEQPPSK